MDTLGVRKTAATGYLYYYSVSPPPERCSITLCLIVESHCSSCMQCGAVSNNTHSLHTTEGSIIGKQLMYM